MLKCRAIAGAALILMELPLLLIAATGAWHAKRQCIALCTKEALLA